ncbi:MAG: hypothetical protein FWD17_18785 [Polyangiaceae bacterium]|nr:hypothetical protein [Polyangiaceae bacterium]
MDRLIPCRSCARHVKACDTQCPFCGEAIDAKAIPPTNPYNRMIAAAAVATGVATLIGCSSGSSGSSESTAVFYGAANIIDASPGDDAPPPEAGSPSAVVFYGFPSVYDATAPEDASSSDARDDGNAPSDGSVEDSPSVVAFYGTVRPPDDGGEQG